MYAIVRCGGRQEKASVDDVLTVDKLAGEAGSTVTLPAVLVVDDGTVVSDPAEVRRYTVTAEILGTVRGPKINMVHYRSKTGYKRRLGHRQQHTQLKITGISPDGEGGSGRTATSRGRAGGGTDGQPETQRAGTGSGTATTERSGSPGGSGGAGGRSGAGRGASRSRTASGQDGAPRAAAARSGSGSGTKSSRGGSASRSRTAGRASAPGGDQGGGPAPDDQPAPGGQES